MPARLVPELVDAFKRASAAWVLWDGTPDWRVRCKARRRADVERIAAEADRLRGELGTDGDELRLIDLLDTRGRAPRGAIRRPEYALGPWRRLRHRRRPECTDEA